MYVRVCRLKVSSMTVARFQPAAIIVSVVILSGKSLSCHFLWLPDMLKQPTQRTTNTRGTVTVGSDT